MGDSAPQAYALIVASLLVVFALKAGLDLSWRRTAVIFLSLVMLAIAAMVALILGLHRI